MIPTEIIIHHSFTKDNETVSWGAIRKFHVEDRGWKDIGYHFGVEQVGREYEIFVGRMLTEQGAHCYGQNEYSIGVCIVGNFDIVPPPIDQWNLAVRLVRSLCTVFNIPKDQVYPHRKFAPWKTCPGRVFDMKAFLNDI